MRFRHFEFLRIMEGLNRTFLSNHKYYRVISKYIAMLGIIVINYLFERFNSKLFGLTLAALRYLFYLSYLK